MNNLYTPVESLPPIQRELCRRCMGTGIQENQHPGDRVSTGQCFACRGTGVVEYETQGETA